MSNLPRGAQLTGGRMRIHTCVCLTAAPCSVLTLCDQHKDSLKKPLGLLVSSRAVEHGWAYPISYWQNPAHMQRGHPSSVVRGWMAGRGHRVTTGGGTFLNPGLTLLLSVRGRGVMALINFTFLDMEIVTILFYMKRL